MLFYNMNTVDMLMFQAWESQKNLAAMKEAVHRAYLYGLPKDQAENQLKDFFGEPERVLTADDYDELKEFEGELYEELRRY